VEIVAATLENVRRNGQGEFVFELDRFQTNQSGVRTPENFGLSWVTRPPPWKRG